MSKTALWRMGLALFLILLYTTSAYSDDLPLGEVIPRVNCVENPEKSYALYLPSNYTPDKPWPMIMLYEPASRARLPLRFFQEAAETFGFILACTYDTANYTDWEQNRLGVEAMWNDLIQRFSIDRRRMYVSGFSGGARLGSRVAMVTGGNAALIACGAGLWVQMKENPPIEFDIISTVGNEDFNFLELVELRKDLNQRKLPNRMLVFDGPHLWPDKDVCYEALGWLQVRAWQKGWIEKDAVLINDQIKRRSTFAKTFEEAGDLLSAHDRYWHLIEDFPDEAGLADVKAHFQKLDASPDYANQVKEQVRSEKLEVSWRQEFLGRIAWGTKNAGSDPNGAKKDLRWWKKEVKNLQKRRDSDDLFKRHAANRVFNLITSNIYERTVFLLRRQQFSTVIHLNTVATMLQPKAVWTQLNMAKAYAQRGEFDEAFEALENAKEYGLRGPGPLQNEPLYLPIRDLPRFKAFVESLESKQGQ